MGRLAAVGSLLLGLAACAASDSSGTAPAEIPQPSDPEAQVLQVVGTHGEPPDRVWARLLAKAAATAEAQGHARFAVLDQRIEEVPGSAKTVTRYSTRIPIVRSRRRGRGSGGAMSAIESVRVVAYRAWAAVRPFTGTPPEGAKTIYEVSEIAG